MREILFRGKRIDDGEWVEGTPFIFKGSCKMICAVALHPDFVDEGNVYYSEGFRVDLSTVGQYTGLTDKNGRRVFEGDIVFCWSYTDKANCVVIFESGEFHLVPVERYKDYTELSGFHAIRCFEKEIVGNIHDNPELLEAQRD